MAMFSEIVVKENVRLLKTRTLPSPGKVLVKAGDMVGPTAIIAKTDFLRESPRLVDLRTELNVRITPELVDSVMVKTPGDLVKTGQVLARFTGRSPGADLQEVLSPCDGVVQYVSRLDGKILIREDAQSMKPMCVVPVSTLLGANPKWLRTQVTVKEGHHVKEGQIIAGFPEPGSYEMVYAPISGIVTRICPKTGSVTIVRPMETLKVLAHIPGKITEVLPDQGAVIESHGSYIEGVYGVGGECHGTLWISSQNPKDVLEADQICSDIEGKILVAGAGATYAAMEKAAYLGAKGIIAGGLNHEDMIAITKLETSHFHSTATSSKGSSKSSFRSDFESGSNFTMIMTEGAGFMPMNGFAWETLKKNQGNVASIDGTTQFTGDLFRPWVFIGAPSNRNSWSYEMKETGLESRKITPGHRNVVLLGDRVRCVRQPYFGLWGTVEEILSNKIALESEALMEAVRIRLDDGSLVDVAEANVEVVTD